MTTPKRSAIRFEAWPFRSVIRRSVWSQNHFFAIIFFIAEHGVALRGLLQRHVMRDDEGGINFSFLNPLQQGPHVALHVALSTPNGEGAIHDGADGEFVDEPGVYADH